MQGPFEQKTFTQTLVQNTLLLRLLADYYQNFVYAIPEKLFLAQEQNLKNKTDIFAFLMQSSRLGLHEDYFTKHLGLTNQKDEDFFHGACRIALLPKPYLQRLLLMVGMSLCRESIIKTVSRKDVEKIRQLEDMLLPEAHDIAQQNMSPYTFAVQKSLTYVGHSEYVRKGAQQKACASHFDTLDLQERIVAWGLWSIFSCVQLAGDNALQRTRIILNDFCALLPQFFAKEPAGTPHMLQDIHDKEALAWPLIRVIVFKEISCPWEDGWTTLFA